MTLLKCKACQGVCVFKSRTKENEIFGACCDLCHDAFCKSCAKLTTTEAHAVSLTQRTILFYCFNCKARPEDHLVLTVKRLKAEIQLKDKQLVVLEENRDDATVELQSKIKKLTDDNKAKDVHIKRLNRRTQDFEEDVLVSEQNFTSVIDNHKKQISELNRQISVMSDKNKDLLEKIREAQVEILELQQKLNEVNVLKHNMLTSIETLTQENELYIEDLKTTKLELFNTRNELFNAEEELCGRNRVTSFPCASKSAPAEELPSKKSGEVDATLTSKIPLKNDDGCKNNSVGRILILSDQLGYNLGSLIQNSSKGLSVQSIIKPHANFANVILNLADLTQDFTLSDHVVILAGYNDLNNKRYPLFRSINGMLKNLGHTNFLVLSVPYKNSDPYVNYAISRFNDRLAGYVNRLNQYVEGHFCFLDCNLGGIPMKKKELSKSIVNILFSKPCTKNLLFVKVCDTYRNAELINGSNDLNISNKTVTADLIDQHSQVDNSDNGLLEAENTNFLDLSHVIIDS